MILPGTRNPPLEDFLKSLYQYRFDELWTGDIPKDCQGYWNLMPTAWKVKIGGWGHDAEWIEKAIRARCRDFLISARTIAHRASRDFTHKPPYGMVSPWCYYMYKVFPITGIGAFTGFSLATAALLTGYYWAGIFGQPYGPPPTFHEGIDPTIMISDNMETGKEPILTASHESVQFQLIPGAGLAGSKALRITFGPGEDHVWRKAHIKYLFPGPLRQFVLCGFNLRQLTLRPFLAAEFFVTYTQNRRQHWAGFTYSWTDAKYPWTLVQPTRQHFFPINPGRRPISTEYLPSWWEIDTQILEYTKLNTFAQLHNVKGEPILADGYTQPQPGELNIILWHGWAEEMVLELDAVVLYEYGPYADNIHGELNDRSKDMPIKEHLPSALA